MGRFMSRDYVTLVAQKMGNETIWNETSVSRIRVKSMVARLTRTGTRFTANGFVLHDGTPLKSVEVRVDNGPWQAARMDPANTQFSWKLFNYEMEQRLARRAHDRFPRDGCERGYSTRGVRSRG